MGACSSEICQPVLKSSMRQIWHNESFIQKIEQGPSVPSHMCNCPELFWPIPAPSRTSDLEIVTSLNLSRHHNSAVLILLININPDPLHGEVKVNLFTPVRQPGTRYVAMKSLFKDTLFGTIVNIISRGKLFAHQDTYDEELRQRYLDGPLKQDESSDELEKGGEFTLIEFLEDDPDVSDSTKVGTVAKLTIFLTEPSKLVTAKKVLCDWLRVSSHVQYLHWFCDLHGGSRWC